MSAVRLNPYLLTVIALGAVFAILAMLFGYISVDSWYYMLLAESLRHGHGCSLHGEYSAVYPCGYPAILALTAPVARPEVMMISSKIINLILLVCSFWFILKASRQVTVAALVVLNPVSLLIFMYTWSENLLLFCLCGVVYALTLIHEGQKGKWASVWLTGFLVLGCFARYFWGPFAFLLFLSTWPAFGRRTALKVLPAFCIAGCVFIVYQLINHEMTGFGTGMPRVAAPEAPLLLIRRFLIALGDNGLGVAVAAALIAGIAVRRWPDRRFILSEATRPALFILLAGLSFLALAFWLRFRTFFDPYNTRTIGYGAVLTVAGLVGMFLPGRPLRVRWALLAMCACALFSLLYADEGALVESIHDAFDDYQFPASSLAALKSPGYQAPGYQADVRVWFSLPVPGMDSANVDNVPEVWYGPNVNLITPLQGPGIVPETPSAFLHRLDGLADERCAFDFTPFATVGDFQTWLGASTVVDHRLNGQTLSQPNLSPDMRRFLISVFQTARLVPCRDIIALPQSRAALMQTSAE
ncbi:MAG: hypothetical protein QM647_16225 [Asticcacaulis sp.]|uniref:hypothetical protein n=1 Tax=Asticcacaulis sp. TaxID=1872648 RepID=UPI0039E4BE2E